MTPIELRSSIGKLGTEPESQFFKDVVIDSFLARVFLMANKLTAGIPAGYLQRGVAKKGKG